MPSKEDRQELAAMAGATVAFFNHNKELKKWFNKALDEGWTPDRLLAKIKTTKWFKRHDEAQRQALTLKYTDPSEYKARLAETERKIVALHRQYGLTGFSEKEQNRLARLAYHNQWDETRIAQYIDGLNNISRKIRRGGKIGGEAGRALLRIQQLAYANGIRISRRRMAEMVENIATGRGTEEWLMQYVQRQAISAFPGLKDEILGGMSVRDYADQYIQAKAELLEMNPAEIDLYDKDIRQALNSKDQKGRISPLTLSDFERRLRKDKRWLRTDNARESLMGVGHDVLQSFGVSW